MTFLYMFNWFEDFALVPLLLVHYFLVGVDSRMLVCDDALGLRVLGGPRVVMASGTPYAS